MPFVDCPDALETEDIVLDDRALGISLKLKSLNLSERRLADHFGSRKVFFQPYRSPRQREFHLPCLWDFCLPLACNFSVPSPRERLNMENRRLNRAVGVFPSVESYLQLTICYLVEYAED
jgi:hypothetical protein